MQTLTFRRTSAFGYRLQAEQWVATRLTEVFDFFSAAENLEVLTPPSLRFQVLTRTPIRMSEGLGINYRLRLQGVPFRWRSRITEWDPPHAFTDLQERGPYLHWEHRHLFESVDGGTRLLDVVDYRVLFGPLVHGWLVRPQLKRIFTFRGRVIGQRFGSGSPDGLKPGVTPGAEGGTRPASREPHRSDFSAAI